MKFRLFPQSLLNWNLSKVVDRNCGNCWSIFVLFWISPPMTLEDTIKFQEDPKIITILWKKTTWNMKTAPKMNNDIKREGNQNCKWSAVFTIRFPKKLTETSNDNSTIRRRHYCSDRYAVAIAVACHSHIYCNHSEQCLWKDRDEQALITVNTIEDYTTVRAKSRLRDTITDTWYFKNSNIPN